MADLEFEPDGCGFNFKWDEWKSKPVFECCVMRKVKGNNHIMWWGRVLCDTVLLLCCCGTSLMVVFFHNHGLWIKIIIFSLCNSIRSRINQDTHWPTDSQTHWLTDSLTQSSYLLDCVDSGFHVCCCLCTFWILEYIPPFPHKNINYCWEIKRKSKFIFW